MRYVDWHWLTIWSMKTERHLSHIPLWPLIFMDLFGNPPYGITKWEGIPQWDVNDETLRDNHRAITEKITLSDQ